MQERPEKVKAPEVPEAPKAVEEVAPRTSVSSDSREVVNECQPLRNHKQQDQSSESGVSAEEKEEVCVEPASDQETQEVEGGNRTPDQETSEGSVGTPSSRHYPMRTPQRQGSSTEVIE